MCWPLARGSWSLLKLVHGLDWILIQKYFMVGWFSFACRQVQPVQEIVGSSLNESPACPEWQGGPTWPGARPWRISVQSSSRRLRASNISSKHSIYWSTAQYTGQNWGWWFAWVWCRMPQNLSDSCVIPLLSYIYLSKSFNTQQNLDILILQYNIFYSMFNYFYTQQFLAQKVEPARFK